MEKEQIISTFKEKLGNTSFSDRSISTYVENNLPPEGAEPDDSFWERHINVMKSFQGQYSADLSSMLSQQLPTKVEEYITKHPEVLKEYMKNHPEPEPKVEEPDARYKELEEKLIAMQNAFNEKEKQTTIANTRNSIHAMAKANGLSVNEALWEDAVNSVTIKDGDSTDDIFANAKSIYSDKYKKVFGNGAEPFGTRSSFNASQTESQTVTDFFKRKAKAEGWG